MNQWLEKRNQLIVIFIQNGIPQKACNRASVFGVRNGKAIEPIGIQQIDVGKRCSAGGRAVQDNDAGRWATSLAPNSRVLLQTTRMLISLPVRSTAKNRENQQNVSAFKVKNHRSLFVSFLNFDFCFVLFYLMNNSDAFHKDSTDKWQQIFRPVPRLPTMNWPHPLHPLNKDIDKMDPRSVSQNFIASNPIALQHEQPFNIGV